MKRVIFPLGVLSLVAGFLIATFAQAQTNSNGLAGTVTDKTGAVLLGATVAITGSVGMTQTTVTDQRGEYSFTGLASGSYTISISAPGLRDFHKRGVEVGSLEIARVDAVMEAASTKSTVEVVGQQAAQVETDTSQVSGTVTQKEVVSLGLNGRNFTQLIALAPGVSNQTGQDEAKVGVVGSVKYSVNGGRVEYNTFDVDGSDLLNIGINGSASTLIVYPSLDAIQEVKVLTSNYGAMYGKTASGTVLVATKSGTADFHGILYYFGRHEILNARNFFDETKGAPLYRRHDLGGTIGGPVYVPGRYNTRKDKTFFFFSEEYRQEKSPFPYNQAVPSLAERAGNFNDVCPAVGSKGYPDFLRSAYPDCPTTGGDASKRGYLHVFPNNQIVGPYALPDRNSMAILSSGVIPAPNSTSGCNSTIGSCYAATVSPPTHWREDLFRVDHNFTSNMRLMARMIHDSWDTVVPTPQWGIIQDSFPTIQNDFVGPGVSAVARLTQTLSPTFLNDFLFSYTNSTITLSDKNGPNATWQRPAALDAPCAKDTTSFGVIIVSANQCPMGFLFDNGFGGKMPGIVIGGTNAEYGGNGFAVDAGYMPWHHTNPTYTFTDNVGRQIGNHNVQFGAQFILYQRDQTNNAIGAASGDAQGILTFSNLANLNSTGNAFADFLFHGPAPGDNNLIKSFQQDSTQLSYAQRYRIAEPYFQDNWRLNKHFTVNLGVRLSLFGTYYEKNHTAYNWVPGGFNPALTAQVGINSFTGALQGSQQDPVTGQYQPIPLDLNNLDPRITNGLVHCGSNGVPSSCMRGHLFNPAPRIGFAWDPKGDGKTAVRGGYGIFYEHGAGNEANTGSLEASAPLVLSMTQYFPNSYNCIGGVGSDCAIAQAFPLDVTSIPTRAVWPYMQQWSLSVQRELPGSMVATMAYVGSKGTHLTDQRQLNQLPPVPASANPYGRHEPFIPDLRASNGVFGDCVSGIQGTGAFRLTNPATLAPIAVIKPGDPAYVNMQAACYGYVSLGSSLPDPNSLRPYLGLGRIVSLDNAANSTYSALQATLRRTAGPLTLGVSYSYSHSLDDSSDRSDATFVNSYDLRSNKASSNFDQRHLLSVSYICELPILWILENPLGPLFAREPGSHPAESIQKALKGWELSGLTVYQSGTPFSVVNAGGSAGYSVPDNAGVANDAGLGSYPDLVGNPYGPVPGAGNNGRSFGPLLLNAGAFVAPRGLTFGDAGRNALNNPNRLNFDTALLKHIKIREGAELELRLEAFNVFNHTQFRIYNPNLGNQANNIVSCYGGSGAGYSAAGGDGVDCLTGSAFLHPVDAHRPRTMQFGIKFSF